MRQEVKKKIEPIVQLAVFIYADDSARLYAECTELNLERFKIVEDVYNLLFPKFTQHTDVE